MVPAVVQVTKMGLVFLEVKLASQRACAALFMNLENHGRYTPYGTKPTLVFPGTSGGAT